MDLYIEPSIEWGTWAGGNPIGSGSSLGGFTFETNVAPAPNAATYYVIDDCSNQISGSTTGPVPEPGTIALFSMGLLGVFGYVWRRRKQAA